MKEHPIIFSAPMVHAILGRYKTQTRRIDKKRSGDTNQPCRYGGCGDRLWVKEAFKHHGEGVIFRADAVRAAGPWMSPLFLKRKHTRIVLELVSTRHARLHDVHDDDARAEGMPIEWQGSPRAWFETQWQQINGGWSLNPWVWVLEFKVLP